MIVLLHTKEVIFQSCGKQRKALEKGSCSTGEKRRKYSEGYCHGAVVGDPQKHLFLSSSYYDDCTVMTKIFVFGEIKVFLLIPNRYDDYDYGEINQLLDRSFKIYIKTVVCAPEKTTNRMYDSFWRQFKHSEKVCSSNIYFDFAILSNNVA